MLATMIGAAGLSYLRFKRRGAKMLANGKRLGFAAAAVILVCCPSLAHAVPINYSWSTVGDPGNAADTATGKFGAVNYVYDIGTYDVTSGQYTAFLNAVAATDTYGLWNSSMAPGTFAACGIQRHGSSGGYTYSVVSADANFPRQLRYLGQRCPIRQLDAKRPADEFGGSCRKHGDRRLHAQRRLSAMQRR